MIVLTIAKNLSHGFADVITGPENFKYLLQMNGETRRFKPLNWLRSNSATESLMTTANAQSIGRFYRRLRRPGFHHAGWVVEYL